MAKKIFSMKADVLFIADDIEDAFAKLEKHFWNMRMGNDSDLIQSGEIKISPLKED